MTMHRVNGAAYGAVAVVVFLVCAQDVQNALLWLHDYSSSTTMFGVGLAGTAFASFGPFLLSLCCWRLAARIHARWAVHLLFIPCAYAFFYIGAFVMDTADGRPWTNEPADHALVPASLLLCLTVLVHAVALALEIGAMIRRRPDAS